MSCADGEEGQDVLVGNVQLAVSNPLLDTVFLQLSSLDWVSTGRIKSVLLVGDCPKVVLGERSSDGHKGVGLGVQSRHGACHDLVSNWRTGRVVLDILIDNGPRSFVVGIGITDTFACRRQDSLLGSKAIAGPVLCAASRLVHGVDLLLYDGVVGSVDVRVDSQREEMLVVMGIDSRGYLGTKASWLLSFGQHVQVQDARELDVQLNVTIHVQRPVDLVFVVCYRADHRDD